MRKNKTQKINFKIIFILLILIILAIVLFRIQPNKKQSDNINIQADENSKTSPTSEVSENSNMIEEAAIPEVQKVNEQRKTCSKITTERNIPVLMYHFFYDANAGETARDNNFMEIHNFEEQIKYLAENNYYVPTWNELADFISGKVGLPEKSIILTVDDGDESFFRLAVPVLEKYNFYATSFLITSWYADRVTTYTSPVIDYQSHSNDMHRAGSDGKGAMLTLDYSLACEDLQICKNVIGDNCKIFCYPFGHFNDRAKQILKDCGYTMAFTTQGGYVTPGMDPYELPRVRMSNGISLNSFIQKVQ